MNKRLRITIISSVLVLAGFAASFTGAAHLFGSPATGGNLTRLPKAGESGTASGATNRTSDQHAAAQNAATNNKKPVVVATTAAARPQSAPASPKQTELRQSTKLERVYYPLTTPNDPGYAQSSWPLTSMNAPAAWSQATGTGSTVIAVLDSGFALNHDDLKDSWYQNSGETGMTAAGDACWTGVSVDKATNNCDDDGNGYIDDWRGWNFYDGTNNPMAGQDNPLGQAVSHGTETAGLSGAKGNNGTGIATLNWNTKLMPLKVLSDDGPGYTSDVAAAVYYAVDNGADVINLSLGGNDPDDVLLAATNYAYAHNVVVVAAAGNCGTGTGSTCSGYPAGMISYPARNPHVISVGAVTSAGDRASFSSYGDALDVVAPGSGSIYSTTWTPQDGTSQYKTSLYGTSYAAPFVSSLASLLKSVRTSATPDEITALILGTAQKNGIADGVYSTALGHGIVDANKAVTVARSFGATSYHPTLYQTGNNSNEHMYSQSAAMASGCATETASAYCAIWLQQEATGYDRILPYTAATNKYVSWTWNTSMLSGDAWSVRAAQAGDASTAYWLLGK